MIYVENAHKVLSDGGMGVCVYLGVVCNRGQCGVEKEAIRQRMKN